MKKKEIHSLHVASWRERQKKGPPPPRSEQYLRQTEWKDRGNGTDSRGIFLDQPFGTVIGFPPLLVTRCLFSTNNTETSGAATALQRGKNWSLGVAGQPGGKNKEEVEKE